MTFRVTARLIGAVAVVSSFVVGLMATPAGALLPPSTPTISNIPGSPVFGGSFTASVNTDSTGVTSVTSSTPSVCTVGLDNLTVSFVGVGTCTLTPHVAATARLQCRRRQPHGPHGGPGDAHDPDDLEHPGQPRFRGELHGHAQHRQ